MVDVEEKRENAAKGGAISSSDQSGSLNREKERERASSTRCVTQHCTRNRFPLPRFPRS